MKDSMEEAIIKSQRTIVDLGLNSQLSPDRTPVEDAALCWPPGRPGSREGTNETRMTFRKYCWRMGINHLNNDTYLTFSRRQQQVCIQ